MQVNIIGKALKYRGRRLEIGETVDMDSKHVRVMEALGRVEVAPAAGVILPVVTFAESIASVTEREEALDAAAEESMPKRRYKRRDMVAE